MEEADSALAFDIDDVSSEYPGFSARNLLEKAGGKPWTVEEAGTPQASLVLKLKPPSKVASIKVVNNWTALLEVQAQTPVTTSKSNGSSSASDSDWETIVAKSSLMTPLDSRNKKNGNNERVLTPKSTNTVYERIKFVCQQPFNKELLYGLTSVEVEPGAGKVNGLSQPGGLKLKKKEKNGDIKAGDLFASSTKAVEEDHGARKSESEEDEAKSDVSSSKPGKVDSKTNDDDEKTDEKVKDETEDEDEEKTAKPSSAKKRKGGRPKKAASKSPSSSKGKGKTSKRKKDEEEDVDVDVDVDDEETGTSSRKKTRRGGKAQNLKGIMKGCVIALSGFVNPERSEIRDKVLEMGSKYRSDWTSDCTHLICAFPNTPKYSQVRAAGGRIAKKEWIDQCYTNKRMIPWRQFMMKPNKAADVDDAEELEDAKANEDDEYKPDSQDLEGDDEEDEEADVELSSDEFNLSDADEEEFSGSDLASDRSESESSGEDRKDRRKRGGKGKKGPSPKKKAAPKKKASPKRKGRGVHYDDTDEEMDESDLDLTDTEEDDVDTSKAGARQRPLLRNMHFFLFGDFPDDSEEKDLVKVIKDLAGTVREFNDEEVTHCVTPQKWNENFDEAISENPHIIFVSPQWIYDCQKHRTLLDARKYKPKQAS